MPAFNADTLGYPWKPGLPERIRWFSCIAYGAGVEEGQFSRTRGGGGWESERPPQETACQILMQNNEYFKACSLNLIRTLAYYALIVATFPYHAVFSLRICIILMAMLSAWVGCQIFAAVPRVDAERSVLHSAISRHCVHDYLTA